MNDMRGVVLHIIMFSPEVGPVIIPVLEEEDALQKKNATC